MERGIVLDSKSREIPFLRRLLMISAAICVATTVIGYSAAMYVTRMARYHHGDVENRAGCLALIKTRDALGGDSRVALNRLIDVNPMYFARDTSIISESVSVGQQRGLCETTLDPSSSLRTRYWLGAGDWLVMDSLPPRWDARVPGVADQGGPSRESIPVLYRVNPLIFGVSPEAFMAGVIFLCLGIALLISNLLTHAHLVSLSRSTRDVFDRLRSGDLKARLEAFGPRGGALVEGFNEMAGEMERLVVGIQALRASQSALIQNVAHDLKTPLASLHGFLENIAQHGTSMTDATRGEFLKLSLLEVRYLSRLIEDLLFIATLGTDVTSADLGEHDLSTIIGEEVELMSRVSRIVIGARLSTPALFRCDPMLVKRLVRNGIDNALKHAREHVEIVLRPLGQGYEILVIDDGLELSDEAIAQFGTKRRRRIIDQSPSGRISLGLGSVIMCRIAEHYHGSARLERGGGEVFPSGTTLRIRLGA